jgi:hypothetical protein
MCHGSLTLTATAQQFAYDFEKDFQNTPDGPFTKGETAGQYRNGHPWGQWKFTLAGPWSNPTYTVTETVDLKDGTAHWIRPGLCGNQVYPIEEGNLEKGLQEGLWSSLGGCNGLPLHIGAYTHGKKTGQWREYCRDGKLSSISTYVDGELNGYFSVWQCDGGLLEHIEGDIRQVPGSVSKLPVYVGLVVTYPTGGVLFQGVWRFYGIRGELLGENRLNENHHFISWTIYGTKTAEGDIVDGLPSGVWHIYTNGQPQSDLTFADGKMVGSINRTVSLPPPVFTAGTPAKTRPPAAPPRIPTIGIVPPAAAVAPFSAVPARPAPTCDTNTIPCNCDKGSICCVVGKCSCQPGQPSPTNGIPMCKP